MIAMSARICRAHFDGLPLRANGVSGADCRCTHAPVVAGQSCSFARSRLRHPMRCWQHLSDGAIARVAQMIAMSARTCRAHFDGLPLRANVQAESDLKCTHAPRLPGRAAALLARGCVAGAIVRMWDCWSRANGAVSAYMPRAFSLAACFLCPGNGAWKRSQMHACTVAAGQSRSFAVTRCGAGSI